MTKKTIYADDDKEAVSFLLRLRLPSLLIGLILGSVLSIIASRFEEVLAQDIRVAFFMPFIVYMAAAVGNQTQSIYIRDLRTGKANFKNYLIKESAIGMILGLLLGGLSFAIVSFWFSSIPLAMSVAISMFAAVATAPLLALFVSEILELEHQDPAVGAGPIATVVQDTVSVVIYGFISTLIILG